MPDKIHPWDLAAADLVDWLEEEPKYYVEALKGGYRAPFSAGVSEDQKLDYYRRQVFMTNNDGTPDYGRPNPQGRDMLLQRVGIPGYTQILSAVMPRKGLQAPSVDDDPATQYDESTMQQERESEAYNGG